MSGQFFQVNRHEKEKFIRHALDEWDRRHFRPDGSWRQDWIQRQVIPLSHRRDLHKW